MFMCICPTRITGIAEAFKDQEFSKSWIVEVNEE